VSVELVIALLVGVSGATAGVYTVWASRANRRADVAQTVTGMFQTLAGELRAELDAEKLRRQALEAKVNHLEVVNASLRRHNEILSAQVVNLGGTPLPMPEE
jgi:hypothetical protein